MEIERCLQGVQKAFSLLSLDVCLESEINICSSLSQSLKTSRKIKIVLDLVIKNSFNKLDISRKLTSFQADF